MTRLFSFISLIALPFCHNEKPESSKLNWDVQLGSWEQVVKDSCLSEEIDTTSTLEALIATGQNFHMFNINTAVGWADFQSLVSLASTKGTSIEFYAVMPAPHLGHANSIWFADCDDESAFSIATDCASMSPTIDKWVCNRKLILKWLDAWIRAGAAVSDLSMKYPDNVKGMVINDFMDYIESADYPVCYDGKRLTKLEIQKIQDAVKSVNVDCGFYPAITGPDVGRFVSEGYVLGSNYGVRMRPEESVSVKFKVALLPDPREARITFFSSVFGDHSEIYRSVIVTHSGISDTWSLGSFSDVTDDEVRFEDHRIDLDVGANFIEFNLHADPSTSLTSGCGNNFWYIWDVKVRYYLESAARVVEIPLTPEYEVQPDKRSYAPVQKCNGEWFDQWENELNNEEVRCCLESEATAIHCDKNAESWCGYKLGSCCPELDSDPLKGYLNTRLVAAPTKSYLIQDAVDGIVLYVTNTDDHGPADALHPKWQYPKFLESTKQQLGSDQLVVMHTAFAQNHETNVEVLTERIRQAAQRADASGVFRFPLGMYFMDPSDRRGIFAECDPFTNKAVANSDCLPTTEIQAHFMARWPEKQSLLPGWYQQWEHRSKPGSSTDLQVEVWDTRTYNAERSGAMQKMTRNRFGTTPLYRVDPFQDDDLSYCVKSITSERMNPVIIGLKNDGECTVSTKAFFYITDQLGTEIPKSAWIFTSGVDNTHTLEVYEQLVEVFMDIRSH